MKLCQTQHSTTVNLSRRNLPRDSRGRFLPSQSSTLPNAPSPLIGSEYLFPSEPQSPEQAPASPPEHASTRGIPPTSRPDSPDNPNYDDLYRAFGDLSPLTPPPSALATTRQRQRALTSPPTMQPVLLALSRTKQVWYSEHGR